MPTLSMQQPDTIIISRGHLQSAGVWNSSSAADVTNRCREITYREEQEYITDAYLGGQLNRIPGLLIRTLNVEMLADLSYSGYYYHVQIAVAVKYGPLIKCYYGLVTSNMLHVAAHEISTETLAIHVEKTEQRDALPEWAMHAEKATKNSQKIVKDFTLTVNGVQLSEYSIEQPAIPKARHIKKLELDD